MLVQIVYIFMVVYYLMLIKKMADNKQQVMTRMIFLYRQINSAHGIKFYECKKFRAPIGHT